MPVPLHQHALWCCIHDQNRSFQAKKKKIATNCITPKKGAVQQAHATNLCFIRSCRSCTQSEIRLIASPHQIKRPSLIDPVVHGMVTLKFAQRTIQCRECDD
jgi:hypothetical protein